jgi:uncharacterized membrane protein YqiK
LAAAEFSVQINKQNAEAAIEKARGDAQALEIIGKGRANAYRVMVETLGQEQVAQLELLKLVVDGKVRITPDVMVSGGVGSGSNAMDALSATILRREVAAGAATSPPLVK